MSNPQEMFQTKKNVNFSTNRQNRLSNFKRKRFAVLAKPRILKPGAVKVFCLAWDEKTTPFFSERFCEPESLRIHSKACVFAAIME
jgi:hypothetical protein